MKIFVSYFVSHVLALCLWKVLLRYVCITDVSRNWLIQSSEMQVLLAN